jgi:flagellar hook-associated protein 1 FlgK
VLPGNTINLTYTDSSNNQHQVSIVNVTDPAALPLKNGANANPLLVGVNFSLSMASVVSQLNTALGPSGLTFSNPPAPPSNSLLNIVGSSTATVNAASTTTTSTAVASGIPQLALFTDGNSPYTGQYTKNGPELTGLAGRISINPAVINNPAALSVYSTSPQTPAGDNTRSDFLFTQLTSGRFTFSPSTGLGSAAQPFTGTISNYLQSFISQQGNASTLATQLQQGQSVVVNTLQQKFDSTASVNIDTEMANLIQVQNTYAANAHIMSVVQSMMQSLLQAQV